MAESIKMLGQSFPAAATLTALYTVPSSASAVGSTLTVCNQDDAPTTFRVSIAVAGAADASKQYVYYDVPLASNDTFAATIGWSLTALDAVRVRSGNGRCSFNLFGVERT